MTDAKWLDVKNKEIQMELKWKDWTEEIWKLGEVYVVSWHDVIWHEVNPRCLVYIAYLTGPSLLPEKNIWDKQKILYFAREAACQCSGVCWFIYCFGFLVCVSFFFVVVVDVVVVVVLLFCRVCWKVCPADVNILLWDWDRSPAQVTTVGLPVNLPIFATSPFTHVGLKPLSVKD